jgi:hypothetical protein
MLDQKFLSAYTSSEIIFILVATFPYLAPGGYRSLLLGPMVEGLLGGMSTITATINAYMSDVTPDGSRAAVFARLAGTMMVAFASGPVLGSFLIRFSGNMYVNICADIPLTLQHAAILHERMYPRGLYLLDPLLIT